MEKRFLKEIPYPVDNLHFNKVNRKNSIYLVESEIDFCFDFVRSFFSNFFFSENKMWQWILFCLHLFCLNLLKINAAASVKQVSHRIYLDTLASNYSVIEDNLWQKIKSEKLAKDEMLKDVYGEHYRTLGISFDETGTIWGLGIREYKDVIDKILSINSTTSNALAYLEEQKYDPLRLLSKNTIKDMQVSSDYLHQKAVDKKFWDKILVKVKRIRSLSIYFLLV